MYLAKIVKPSGLHYEIRNSLKRNNGTFGYQTVFDLGKIPENYFEVYEDYIILFSSTLLAAVEAVAGPTAEYALEQLFHDFFPLYAQRKLGDFRRHNTTKIGPLLSEEKQAIAREVHLFDRRRLYYLRYGGVDQSRLSRLHEKSCRPLLGQSRDEREYYFMEGEKALEPGMYLQYVFAIFNLQKHFNQSFATWLPEALALDEMGEYLEKDICSLQADSSFWQGESGGGFLHHHLARYLVMFFDFRAVPRSFFDDFARSFMADHRSFTWPEKKVKATPEKLSAIFSISYESLKAMNRSELNKLYRQRAMELHPDKGGDHEKFITLTDLYNNLLQTKKN